MSKTDLVIRTASLHDAAAVARIYAHHVLHGTASYEIDPPDTATMAARMDAVLAAGWPWLVAERDTDVVGWASASQFRPRPAYAHACEDSIYVAPGAMKGGIGTALLTALIAAAEQCGFRQMVAVIGGAEPASIALHARCGFSEVGRLSGLGWKHGRWLDNVYMQRALGAGASSPP
ncbi:N-acetyltransferase family protein [Sphingomonas sp. KRR8]|uniref:GNAT family N-acetyltransferase n=1 Tax=Sphingomonas sp. KRR8 TaxID=2942996 RepID=UPI002020A239|nr:GNAT family N-acetyltransferase [Sphingomonas sp. KRR8]URD59695.1 N-acetyltransferase family protein [Sphingomonas sp. KRR8]